MVPVGAGQNMAEAAQPVLLTERPRRAWLVASNRLPLENFAYLTDQPCVSQEPMDSLLERVNRLRRQDPKAVIIVSLHWGGEHTLKPVPRQRQEAHRLIDAGADVLVCHHTHTLQTVETYRGRQIYYSIGNFIFDQSRPINTAAAIVRLRITPKRLDADAIPIEIRRCVPMPVTQPHDAQLNQKP
jgi:poly-gamma-glutamate synthesis protein (capsule biosynthesis protein)